MKTSETLAMRKKVKEVTITKVATSATKNILKPELSLVEEEMKKFHLSKESRFLQVIKNNP